MYEQTLEIMNDETFKTEVKRLIKHYNITASAKYTLEPRNDFIQAIVRAALEMRDERAVS